MRILALDGSLGGDHGNSSVLLDAATELLRSEATVERATLARAPGFVAHRAALAAADAIVVATGTYWDSWSSLLQQFLEQATPSEGTELWLGKPAAVLVITRVGELARGHGGPDCEDIWGLSDLEVVCHNLVACARGSRAFRAWTVDRGDPGRRWLER